MQGSGATDGHFPWQKAPGPTPENCPSSCQRKEEQGPGWGRRDRRKTAQSRHALWKRSPSVGSGMGRVKNIPKIIPARA